MHPRLNNSIESLDNTIKLFKLYKDMFSTQIPKQADIGLIQLNSQNARDKIQPTPERYIKEINLFIPKVMRQRCDE